MENLSLQNKLKLLELNFFGRPESSVLAQCLKVRGRKRNEQTGEYAESQVEYNKYRKSIPEYLSNLGYIIGHLDEIALARANRRLSAQGRRSSMEEINDLVVKLKTMGNFPPVTIADVKLKKSSVFKYVGTDNQFVDSIAMLQPRTRELSEMQEECKEKKFPDISMEIRGLYAIYLSSTR
ncbi:MAG: hypothetical protein FWC79_02400 [Oscillospiraceae bacterium]|nr:hypothetical protein [Oscillospiraceae bacterium]